MTHRNARAPILALLLFVTFWTLPGSSYPFEVSAQPSVARLEVWNDIYGSNITDLDLTPSSQFTVEVNVTGAGPINGFDVTMKYYNLTIGSQVLDAVGSTASLGGGLFDPDNPPPGCSQVFVFRNEVDIPQGAIRVAAVLFGGCMVENGTLFTITFDVVGVGAAAIDIIQTDTAGHPETLLGSMGASVPYGAFGASFRNKPGIPPAADFTFDPDTPVRGDTVVFDGTMSYDPDSSEGANRGIERWVWEFGDGTRRFEGPIIGHQFIIPPTTPTSGNFTVRLIVYDLDDGLAARKSLVVRISEGVIHDLRVHLHIPIPLVKVGQVMEFDATLENRGTRDEVANLTVTYDFQGGTMIGKEQVSLTRSGSGRTRTFQYSLQTQGLPPRVYTITAVAVIVNATSGQIVPDVRPTDNTATASFKLFPTVHVEVLTDKKEYLTGETAQITVGIANTGPAPVNLHFNSTCQASFEVIGKFRLNQNCSATTTEAVLRPGESAEYMFTWDQTDYFGRLVRAGVYYVVGRVLSLEPTPEAYTTIEIVPIEVSIDVKPGSDVNKINLKSSGVVPVAILTTPAFDASIVNPSNVGFGTWAFSIGAVSAHVEDVDGDGDTDLLLMFRLDHLWFPPYETEAMLTGTTFDGRSVIGFDTVRVFLPGDANSDLMVDVQDLALLGVAFGSRPGLANWNPYADFDDNGIIDIADLAVVGANFGNHA